MDEEEHLSHRSQQRIARYDAEQSALPIRSRHQVAPESSNIPSAVIVPSYRQAINGDLLSTEASASHEGPGLSQEAAIRKFLDNDPNAFISCRAALDADEMFNESPHHLSTIAKINDICSNAGPGVDAAILHKRYSGSDRLPLGDHGKKNGVIRWRMNRPARVKLASQGQAFSTFDRNAEHTQRWLHVRHDLCSQLPSLRLRIDLEPQGPHAYVQIFATNLDHEAQQPFRWLVSPDQEIGQRLEADSLLEGDELIRQAWQHQRLDWMCLNMLTGDKQDRKGRPHHLDISRDIPLADLNGWANIVAKLQPGEIDEGLTEQERFLGLLHGGHCDQLDIFTTRMTRFEDKEMEELKRASLWFSSAMHMSLMAGHFWWYRLQFPDFDWQDEDFPLANAEPPRWMVTAWAPRHHLSDPEPTLGRSGSDTRGDMKVTRKASSVVASPQAIEWTQFTFPPVWPGEHESSFAARLERIPSRVQRCERDHNEGADSSAGQIGRMEPHVQRRKRDHNEMQDSPAGSEEQLAKRRREYRASFRVAMEAVSRWKDGQR